MRPHFAAPCVSVERYHELLGTGTISETPDEECPCTLDINLSLIQRFIHCGWQTRELRALHKSQ